VLQGELDVGYDELRQAEGCQGGREKRGIELIIMKNPHP